MCRTHADPLLGLCSWPLTEPWNLPVLEFAAWLRVPRSQGASLTLGTMVRAGVLAPNTRAVAPRRVAAP